MEKQQGLDNFFNNMWVDYCNLNPQAREVYKKLTEYGEKVVNDHIAFRTFSHPLINRQVLSKKFLDYGYRKIADYEFKDKKLKASHFEHSAADMPKVFISELDLAQCSTLVNETVAKLAQEINPQNVTEEKFLFSGRPWTASFDVYKKLYTESEYAAWVYAHGFRPNHFTVFINELKKLNKISDLNQFLKTNGFALNSSGGEIKGSPDLLLEQSSTMANEIEVQFSEGKFKIPGCYYEFAKRYPMQDGKLFQGFVANSADKIFESTNQM